MKVVLSGYYGFGNVGDEAILFSIIKALKKIQADIEITVLSNDPDYTRLTYGVAAVNRWSLKKMIKAIKESDGLISGGGSLLQDKTGNRSIFYYSAVMMIAKLQRKPLIVYAQGIGPIEQKRNQSIVKFVLSRATLLTVRDEESKQFLEEIGVRREITLVPDPVLGIGVGGESSSEGDDKSDRRCQWLANAMGQGTERDQNEQAKLREPDEQSRTADLDKNADSAPDDNLTQSRKVEPQSQKFISVSVREWTAAVPFLEDIAATLDKLSGLGYQIIFVPMHGEHDEKTSKNVQSMMTEQSLVAPGELSIEEKIRLIGESELHLGMRLHALIFAAVMDTPFTAISYDPKIDAFASLCQQPVAANVNEVNWSGASLFETVEKQLTNQAQHREKLLDYTKGAKLAAQKTAELTINKLGV